MKPIHPDFLYHLNFKDQKIIDLYLDLRSYLIELFPDGNELLYHTHALTSVHTISEKISDGYCMIPIYTNHLNLGFHKGSMLKDPHNLLKGTGKLIRHISVNEIGDYRNLKVTTLINSAIEFAINDMDKACESRGKTISKIKK